MTNKQQYGGSFAPPLTDALLTQYQGMIQILPASPLKDGLTTLLNCCNQWWQLPESVGTGRPHPSGIGVIVDLDDSIKQSLDAHIPWRQELEMIQGLCDGIDVESQRDLRNAAFHLLWHVFELEMDREPITKDKL